MLITIYKSWKSLNSETIEAFKTNLRKAHIMNSNEHATTATRLPLSLYITNSCIVRLSPFALQSIWNQIDSPICVYFVLCLYWVKRYTNIHQHIVKKCSLSSNPFCSVTICTNSIQKHLHSAAAAVIESWKFYDYITEFHRLIVGIFYFRPYFWEEWIE